MDFFGTCITWVAEKGFGFIRIADGRDIFVHAKVLQRAGLGDPLPVGSRVVVDIETARDGRLRVARIREALGAKLSSLVGAAEGR